MPLRTELRDAAILIVDDEEANVRLLERILARAGFTRVHTTCHSLEVVTLYEALSPDLLVLDVRMPEMDGFAVLAQLGERIGPAEYFPVLAITGDVSPETRQAVIVAGAKDFLEKPFQPSEVVVRVENLLTTRLLHRSLQRQHDMLEKKVHERTAELELALSAAQQASRAKSQFLATMSHELRTPLNAVIGFSQHLQRNKAGNLTAQDQSYLDRIRENGGHLLRIITDILELSQIEAGTTPVELTTVAIEPLIREVIEQISSGPLLAEKLLDLRMAVPSNVAGLVTDQAKLRKVLLNLVGNAVKFTDSGGVVIGVATGAGGAPVRMDIIDTGPGIEPDRLPAVFDKFEQADNSTQRRFGGTGLGLTIARTVCELLGYRLNALSELGAGSVFSVLLDPAIAAPNSYGEVAASYPDAIAVSA